MTFAPPQRERPAGTEPQVASHPAVPRAGTGWTHARSSHARSPR